MADQVGLVALSSSLSVLFDRVIFQEVLNFLKGRKPTEVLLRDLKDSMLSVNAVLADAEEKQLTNPLVKDWVDELKDVLFDAEDILDETATRDLQRKLDAESSTTAKKVLDCISNTFLDTFVKKVGPKIEEVLERLEHLVKAKDVMGLQVGVGGKQYPDHRLSTSYVSESDTFGRAEDKKKVIDLLLSSDARGNEMCVIAIVGMGGIGKTTLAQLAYNDSRVKQHFDLKIWFCVSQDHSVLSKVKRSIIEAATSSTCNIEDHSELLRVTLKKHLNGNKFLLVLDDVWSEEPHHYQELLVQLLHYGNQGSKILVTTRSEKVALAMRAIETLHLKLLPKDDCRSLFEKHAFRNGSSNADPKIKEIGTQIVEKCKGLPLAIKAIGDLLWSESNVERWTNILKSNLWDLPMEGTDILPALRLSYKYLPSYLKRCFAYCSIFPKHHIFEKDELVLLWMAEGFLQPIETMEEVGNRYFDALVSRSLFQQSSRETKSLFVMHDLVNDLAKSVAGQFGTDSLKNIVKMTRYVSCFSECLGTFQDIENDLLKAKQLRTVHAFGFSRGLSSEEIKIPRTILCLRVLSLGSICHGITKLPDLIGEMKYLRYLDVSNAFTLNRLPDSICNLCNLQTLKLKGCCNLDRLPRDMWKLTNLRHLEINGTSKLEEMPIKMGELNCLQTLSKFVSKHDSASGASIGELGKLNNLRGKLLIEELQNVTSAQDALDASLKTKGYLEELVLKWNIPLEEVVLNILDSQRREGIVDSQRREGIVDSQRGVLENLQPHENLKSLSIRHYGGSGFPDWIGGLTSLSELELFECKCCSTLPPLGHLPLLEKLSIVGLDEVNTVGPGFYGNSSNSSMKPFGSLKFLRLEDMSNWANWFYLDVVKEAEVFSQLEELYISNCPELREMLPLYLPSLDKLQIMDCQHLKQSLSMDSFPVLTSMKIIRCDKLEFEHENDGLLSKLKILVIDDCKKCELPMHQQYSSLEALFLTNCCDSLTSISLDVFPNLKCIRIEGCDNLKSLEQHGGDLVISKIGIWRCPNFVSFSKGGLRVERLEFSNDKSEDDVESFPGKLLLPTTLIYLSIQSFGNLKSLDKEGFQQLTSLVQLDIFNCQKLRYMPEEGFPTSLRVLKIVNCDPVLKEELKVQEGKEWLKVASLPNIEIDGVWIRGDKQATDWARSYEYDHLNLERHSHSTSYRYAQNGQMNLANQYSAQPNSFFNYIFAPEAECYP